MSNRYQVTISNPRVVDREMLVAVSIADWSKDVCFYYPVEDIDNKSLFMHVIWKLSGDDKYMICATVEADIDQAEYSRLKLRNWDFA